MGRYHLVTTWRLPGTVEEVAAVLAEVERFPEWWPSVYLAATVLVPGDERGVGLEAALRTRGWLPYTLSWRFRVVEVDPPRRVVIEPRGDFTGRGEWTFAQEDGPAGPVAVVRYDWRVETWKPVLRALHPLLAPVFALNHAWAMRRGEEGLAREMARRRARGGTQGP